MAVSGLFLLLLAAGGLGPVLAAAYLAVVLRKR